MKLFKAITLLFCISMLVNLQAMAMMPDYGLLKVKPKPSKPVSTLVRSTPIEKLSSEQLEGRIFLTDEEHAVLFKKQIENESFKVLTPKTQQNQSSNIESSNENSDSDFDSDKEEAARFSAAYAHIKAQKLLAENRDNLKFITLFISSKQQRHIESPIAEFVSAGKESPFSTRASSSPIAKNDSDENEPLVITSSENDDMFFPLE